MYILSNPLFFIRNSALPFGNRVAFYAKKVESGDTLYILRNDSSAKHKAMQPNQII